MKTMEVTAGFLGEQIFEVRARGHRVICDQPANNGGSDTGMTPPEFLLASLATCAAYYAAQYLKVRQLPTGHLKVRVSAEKAQEPARLDKFSIEVTAPGLDDIKVVYNQEREPAFGPGIGSGARAPVAHGEAGSF